MITNRFDLPGSIMAAIEASAASYDGPRPALEEKLTSATELCAPTRQAVLKRRHMSELEEDASILLWSLEGVAMHHWIRSNGDKNTIQEQRLTATIEDWTISGQIDEYDPASGIIRDFKYTKCYAVMSPKEEWGRQLSIYQWLAQKNGWEVKGLEIQALLKDWTPYTNRANAGLRNQEGYPAKPFITLAYRPWPIDVVEDWIKNRINALEKAMSLLPECSAEERWEKKGVSVRCKSYCSVSPMCSQWKKD